MLKRLLKLSLVACLSCKSFAASLKEDTPTSRPIRSGPSVKDTTTRDLLESLIPPGTNKHWRITITKAFYKIPKKHQSAFVDQMHTILPPEIPDYLRGISIGWFSQIPNPYWETLATDAQDLFTADMNAEDRRNIYFTFSSVPPEKRKEFISQIQALFAPTMTSEERIAIVHAIAYVLPENWPELIYQIQTLFTPDTSNSDQGIIANKIAKVPAEYLKAFVAQVRTLLPSSIKSFRAEIIKAIPQNTLETLESTIEFVNQIQRLVVPGMEGFEYWCIVDKLAEVRISERKEVTDAILSVIPSDVVDPKVRAAIISGLLRHPYPRLRGEWSTIMSNILGRTIPFIEPSFH